MMTSEVFRGQTEARKVCEDRGSIKAQKPVTELDLDLSCPECRFPRGL